jgi:hypothetical protein
MGAVNTASIRAATPVDLERVWDIRFANDVAGQSTIPERGEPPPYLSHLLKHGSFLVAAVDGRVIGYAARVDRGGVAYLTDLFIDTAVQSTAIGRTLLGEIFADDPFPRCTLASTDHRAMALYTRMGMAPRWPNVLLLGETDRLRELPTTDVEMVPADAGDPHLHRWDRRASSRLRPEDLAFFVAAERGQAFWFRRENETIGYGVIRLGAGRLWWPEAVTVGPIGGASAEDATACVLAAVARARGQGSVVEIAVPGPHLALAPLLTVGFRIIYVETYCASTPALIDPALYIGSGGDLF